MESQSTTQQAPAINLNLTPEIIKADMKVRLSKLQLVYQDILQAVSNITFNKDQLDKDYTPLKQIRDLIKKIDECRSEMKKPYFDAGKLIDAAAKELTDPLQKLLTEKTNEFAKLANEIEEERRQAAIESERIAGIKRAMDNFVLTTSQNIAAATTIKELEQIEKLIEVHKGGQIMYQEFLPDMKERIKALTPLLKKQKTEIDKLIQLEADRKKAEKKGDDREALKLGSRIDTLKESVDLRKVEVQEAAIESTMTTSSPTTAVAIPPASVKARRTTWRAEIKDRAEVMKKAPELLDVFLNSEKIKVVMNGFKEAGVFDGKKEYILNGIRYYEDKQF